MLKNKANTDLINLQYFNNLVFLDVEAGWTD